MLVHCDANLPTSRVLHLCLRSPSPPAPWPPRRYCVQYGLLPREEAEEYVIEQQKVGAAAPAWAGS